MTTHIPSGPGAVSYAEFDAGGALLAASGDFANGVSKREDLAGYLAGFSHISGQPMTRDRAETVLSDWSAGEAGIEGRLEAGGWRLLSGHPTAQGGVSVTAIDVSAQKDERKRLKALLDSNPAPIWANETESGRVTYYNEEARQLFEVDATDDREKHIGEFFADEEEHRFITAELTEKGEILLQTLRARSAKGKEFWLRGSARLVQAGGDTYTVSVIQDVSSLEDHESEAVRSRKLLSDAINTLAEGFALFDEDSRLIVCNQNYRDLNPSIAHFIQPGAHWETMLRELAKRGGIRHAAGRENAWVNDFLRLSDEYGDFEIEHLDGMFRSGAVRPTSLGGFVVTLSDVTAHRAAEQAALQSERLLSKILEASPANLCMSRIGDGEVIYRSPACATLFGPGASSRDQFASQMDRADFLTEILPTGRVDEFSANARRFDGSIFPALFSARIIDYRGEDVMVSSVTDLTEQHRSRKKLADANMRLRDAIEALSEGFVLFDADERIVMANRPFHDMNAPYADKITPGAHNREIVALAAESGHLVDGENWLRDYDEEKARGETASRRRFQFRLADGSWITSLRRPTRDGGIVISWLDVTEQKQAEEELRIANDRLRDAIESLDLGFAIFDAEEKLIAWNARYGEMTAHIAGVVQEGTRYRQILEASLANGKIDQAEFDKIWKRRRDSRSKSVRSEVQQTDGLWFSVSLNPTSEGGFVLTRLDITERKRSEEAEREADARMRKVMDATPINLVMSRYANGEIIYRTDSTVETFGDRNNVADYWFDPDAGKRLSKDLKDSGDLDERVFELVGAEDEPILVALSSRKIDYKGEQMVVSHAYDLRERVSMEQELARQRDMLHQSEKLSALGELLAGVAHELNNPLSVVVGHSLMLQEEADDPELERRAEKIGAAAERCSRIVKTFLAMARQRPAALELVSVNAVMETSLEVAGFGLRNSGARVVLDFADNLPLVMADADQLAQVISNLIVNAEHALKNMEEPAEVNLRTALSEDAEQVVIEVSDNGPGIPEEIRARIFEPFFTTKNVGDGTGIGLAFCHRIIEAHDGRITAGESAEGGAAFTIRLAAVADGEVAPGQATVAQSHSRGSVLVIDDEPDVADLIAQILSADGYTVTQAASAEQALALLPGDFDLIMSDVNMPGLGGRAFLTAVSDAWPELVSAIGFVTGDTMSAGAEEFLQGAGRPYLEKPVAPADLRRMAGDIINDRQREISK